MKRLRFCVFKYLFFFYKTLFLSFFLRVPPNFVVFTFNSTVTMKVTEIFSNVFYIVGTLATIYIHLKGI